jgi:flavin reductase (DIM6/NTAB) family NADH-FMN oxidoreductase RutF
MRFDFGDLSARQRYKLMTATITPRPIAWVTTLSADGIANAAPFSFFNMMGDDPPIVVLGFLASEDRALKDSAANILETGEFVVNLVPERLAAAMNATSRNMPAGQDELSLAGLDVAPSARVAPPRIADSPVAFECRRTETVWSAPRQLMIVGDVLMAHIDDACVADAGSCHVDTPALGLIARMHGSDWYARQTDLFQLARPTAFESTST